VFTQSDRTKWSNFYHYDQPIRFEFVNIREQCAWVHENDEDRDIATHKAGTLVEATVARLKAVPAELASARFIEKSALILGNGPATNICIEMLSDLGIGVERISGIPDTIQRSGGLFSVATGNTNKQASALIVIPEDGEASKNLLIAFGRERRRPRIQAAWGGLNTNRPGVFYLEPESDPRMTGTAVVARVLAWINRRESRPPVTAMVDPDRCRACKTCIDTCEYCAPELIEINGRYSSWIDPAICTSCGTCAAHCPSGAISAGCSTDLQLEAMLDVCLDIY
jgi:heterodisulfide reductase subunit A-like polyferredoxin